MSVRWRVALAFYLILACERSSAIGSVDSCFQGACSISIASYSRPIRLFHGQKFSVRDKVHLAYYFHGWWIAGMPSPFEGEAGNFAEFVDKSETNALLIIPESVGRNETYLKVFDTPEKMRLFFYEVESVLKTFGVPIETATRSLSGHSGAYVHLAKLGHWLKSGELTLANGTAFGLFDSAYGFREGLVKAGKALCARGHAVYFVAYNPDDGYREKKKANQKIMRTLRKSRECIQLTLVEIKSPSTVHLDFPGRFLPVFLKSAY